MRGYLSREGKQRVSIKASSSFSYPVRSGPWSAGQEKGFDLFLTALDPEDMLKDRACLVSRDYPRTSDREGKCRMDYRLEKAEVHHSKRSLEGNGEEEYTLMKVSKLSEDQLDTDLSTGGILVAEREGQCHMDYRLEDAEIQHSKPPSERNGEEELVVSKVFKRSDDQITALSISGNLMSEREGKCHMDYRLEMAEFQPSKPVLERNGVEELVAQKLCKRSNDQIDTTLSIGGILTLLSNQCDQSNSQRHAGDNSDSSSLISAIGRDNSISCLIRCSRADYGAIACLNRSFRSLIRSGELYRLRRINQVVEHWVYFSRQLLEWEAFDPNRRHWMHLPTMPPNECFVFADKESLAVGTELLVFGRDLKEHVIYRYSLLTNMWTTGMRMNEPRCLFGSASLGEIAILAGGCDSVGNILSSAELYNSETGTWNMLPSMKKRRKMCSGVFMDRKFYVVGGIGPNMEILTCGEEYNLETETWTEIPKMSPVRTGAARDATMPVTSEAPPLIAVVNNELYAADYADMEVRKYNKNDGLWVTIGRLPERADSMYGWGLAFRACGDCLIVIGGPRTAGDGFIEVNAWVPGEGPPEWDLLGRKRNGSFVYNCAVMGC